MNDENTYIQFKANSKCIKRVDLNFETLTIIWPDNRKECFLWKDLSKVTLITTDEGPFEPDTFWLMMFDIPIMVPDDEMIPGSLAIVDYMLDLPNFDHEKFIEAMSCTDNNAFELWEK